MVLIHILSGSRSGEKCAVGRFPCVIGRAADDQIRIPDPGVWDRHLELAISPSHQITFKANPHSFAVINGAARPEGSLMNGDLLELGAVRLRFWLADSTQCSFNAGELMIWLSIPAISLFQLALIRWLQQ